MVTAGLLTLLTAILATLFNIIGGYLLNFIISGFELLSAVMYVDLEFGEDLRPYVLTVSISFIVAKIAIESLNTYILNFLDDRLENYDPLRIVFGGCKAVVSMVFVPFFVQFVWTLSSLLVKIVGLNMEFDVSNMFTIENLSIVGTFPLLLMIIIYLVALIVITCQFCIRMAEFIFSIYSGFIISISLVNEKMKSPMYTNWVNNVLGLGFIQAAQVLCINLSLKSLNRFFGSGISAGLSNGDTFKYFMLSIGFVMLCASTPATIKQIAHSTGVRQGISATSRVVRTAVSLKK